MIPESQWDSKKLKIFCLMRKEIKYKESCGKIKVHSINRKTEKKNKNKEFQNEFTNSRTTMKF